jgi:uncharacterized protein YjbJ (UPF0337 family)
MIVSSSSAVGKSEGHPDDRRRRAMGAADKVKNAAQKAKGDVKDDVGRATDNRDMQAEGKADKAAGSLKQAGENLKDAVKK